jgi:hypothetical protein
LPCSASERSCSHTCDARSANRRLSDIYPQTYSQAYSQHCAQSHVRKTPQAYSQRSGKFDLLRGCVRNIPKALLAPGPALLPRGKPRGQRRTADRLGSGLPYQPTEFQGAVPQAARPPVRLKNEGDGAMSASRPRRVRGRPTLRRRAWEYRVQPTSRSRSRCHPAKVWIPYEWLSASTQSGSCTAVPVMGPFLPVGPLAGDDCHQVTTDRNRSFSFLS